MLASTVWLGFMSHFISLILMLRCYYYCRFRFARAALQLAILKTFPAFLWTVPSFIRKSNWKISYHTLNLSVTNTWEESTITEQWTPGLTAFSHKCLSRSLVLKILSANFTHAGFKYFSSFFPWLTNCSQPLCKVFYVYKRSYLFYFVHIVIK